MVIMSTVSDRILIQNLNTYDTQRPFWITLSIILFILLILFGIWAMRSKDNHHCLWLVVRSVIVFVALIISLIGACPANRRVQSKMLRNNRQIPIEEKIAKKNYRTLFNYGLYNKGIYGRIDKKAGKKYYTNESLINKQLRYNQKHAEDVKIQFPNWLIK